MTKQKHEPADPCRTDKCPACGRFVERDGDEFYDRYEPDDDSSYMVPFCDENCADRYANAFRVSRLPGKWPTKEMLL